MPPSSPTRVGVIGPGYWGRNLIRVFDQLGALQAVCDSEAVNLAAIEQEYQIPFTFSDPHIRN